MCILVDHQNTMTKFYAPMIRWVSVGVSLFGLLLVYAFQQINYAEILPSELAHNRSIVFIFNRLTRLVINDLLCILLIYSLFQDRRFVRLSFCVFLVELLFILPIYLFIKLSLEGDSEISSPLLSTIHRMVVNPLLMIVLIGGFYYQRFFYKN